MAPLREVLSRETVQMAIVIGIALFAHYFFIRKRLMEDTVGPPEPPMLEVPPQQGEDDPQFGFGEQDILG